MPSNKHLSDADRLLIEHCLKDGLSFRQIAIKINKSPSTVSREIRSHSIISNKWPPYRIHNRCSNRYVCKKYSLCEDKPDCVKLCSSCNLCNQLCADYQEEFCNRLSAPPYVCNGCPLESKCVLQKKYYLHHQAHEAYRNMLVESRSGINISESELLALDEFISPLLLNGQSIHHIFIHNPDRFNVGEKSIYRYVHGNCFEARNIDMPRTCRIKLRKSKPLEHKVDSSCRIGRTYTDFLSFLDSSDSSVVEMDSVIGRVGGKVLLTFLFKSCNFMLAFLRDSNTSQSVIDVFNSLYDLLGYKCFSSMFPVILTDNGSEFSNPMALEFDAHGNRRTRLFYCDPCASFQKPNVELNHEFIRRILPKGTSFDNLSQSDVSLMMSHINSYSREKLNDKSPLEIFGFLYGYNIIDKLCVYAVSANDIILKPSLLNK